MIDKPLYVWQSEAIITDVAVLQPLPYLTQGDECATSPAWPGVHLTRTLFQKAPEQLPCARKHRVPR